MDRWLSQVPAVLVAWYPGQEAGPAPVTVLFGDANPSGKLPVTFLKAWKDSPAFANYPGENLTVNYAEGIYVGYRHLDKNNIEPLFPFGHGLSYTTFGYSDLKVSPAEVAPGQPVDGQSHRAQHRRGRRRGGGPALRARCGIECRPAREGAEGVPARDAQPWRGAGR